MEIRPRVVILEDNEMFAILLAETLGEYCEVVVGHNGLQGIALCLEAHTDLVVTDIGMPDLDGVQMLREFQKNPLLSSIPVLVVTATHFTQRSRSEVERFPQVRAMLSKMERIDVIAEAARKALQGAE